MTNASLLGFARSRPLATALVSAIIVALLGALVASALPKRVKVSMSFTIAQQARQETADYSYDGYYAQRASELVADTMISWLSTPSVIKDIYADAGLDAADVRAFTDAGRAFRAKKFSSQNVVVTFTADDSTAAQKLADASARILSGRAAELVLSSKRDSLFHVTASAPVIAPAGIPPKTAALAGIFIGAFLGFLAAYVAGARKNS